MTTTTRCNGRYPVPGKRDEPFEVTYRCGGVVGHGGAHGPCPGEPMPTTSDDVDLMIAELKAAHWIPKTSVIWKAPNGTLHLGPAGAWRTMKATKDDAAAPNWEWLARQLYNALRDFQTEPNCWCDAGESAPMHSPACAYARDVERSARDAM